jgi:hypothetical protein
LFSPKRRRTRLTVAGDTPVAAAICLPVQRCRRSRSISSNGPRAEQTPTASATASGVCPLATCRTAVLDRAASDRHDPAATMLFGTVVVVVAFTFRDYTISNDEQRYGGPLKGIPATKICWLPRPTKSRSLQRHSNECDNSKHSTFNEVAHGSA